MSRPQHHRSSTALADLSGDHPEFAPTIETTDVFRQLIADEVRSGRLTPSRRRRVVRFAARLNLTPVQAGRMIEECKTDILHSEDPLERFHALRLVNPPEGRIPAHFKIALAIAGALAIDVAIVLWLWKS